jgi:hypothetical protein
MKHRFFIKTKQEQNTVLWKIASITILANLFISGFSILLGLYILPFFSVVISLSIVAPFFDIPSLKKTGRLIYFSNLFIDDRESKGIIIIHGGSLFDYTFVLDKTLKGRQRNNYIIQQYIQGLLNLIENLEKKAFAEVKVKGATYILNDRTAKKLGFEIVKTDFLQKLILTYNYVNLLVSNSFAKGKITFPRLGKVKTLEASISELIKHKEFIIKLNLRLLNTLPEIVNNEEPFYSD